MLNLADFRFGKVYNCLEIGHIIGGAKSSTGSTSCSTSGASEDGDNSQGDYDIKEVKTP